MAWADAWHELTLMMQDPEVGFAVQSAYWDPTYTIYVWPYDEGPNLGGRRAGVTQPRENERACDISINRDLSGAGPDGFPTTFRQTFWHEVGHGIFNWRFENKQYQWRGGKAYVVPWVNRATNAEALRYENRTVNGPPWRTVHY